MKTSTILTIVSGVGSVALAGVSAVCSLVSKKEADQAQTDKINKAVADALANRALETGSEM